MFQSVLEFDELTLVELEGIEPSSKQGTSLLSTCLALLACRDWPGERQPNQSLTFGCFIGV